MNINMKRIRTLLTLFMLIMGTMISWAEFENFAINQTEAESRTADIPSLPVWCWWFCWTWAVQDRFPYKSYTFVVPTCYIPTNVKVTGGFGYNDGINPDYSRLGYRCAVVRFYVDRPVKFAIGTSSETDHTSVSVDGGGDSAAVISRYCPINTNGCWLGFLYSIRGCLYQRWRCEDLCR